MTVQAEKAGGKACVEVSELVCKRKEVTAEGRFQLSTTISTKNSRVTDQESCV